MSLTPAEIDAIVARYTDGELDWDGLAVRGVDLSDAWLSLRRIKRPGEPVDQATVDRANQLREWGAIIRAEAVEAKAAKAALLFIHEDFGTPFKALRTSYREFLAEGISPRDRFTRLLNQHSIISHGIIEKIMLIYNEALERLNAPAQNSPVK